MSAPLPVGSERDAASRQIGRFTVLGLVGRGGLGEVYAAYDPELDRRVALKVLVHADDRSGLARLRREAMAMARLSHPNVARVFDVGSIDSRLFIAMEFIRGQTLRAWLAEQPRTWREVREVFLAAGHGLAAAHREGIIHRDFKPKSRRPSQTAPQPTARLHSHLQGRFERVDVYRLAPTCPGVPQVLAKRWQRAGPPEERRGHAPRPHRQGGQHDQLPSHPHATAAPRAAAGR